MSEIVVDARILVYRATVALDSFREVTALDNRLLRASTLVAPSCEFLRSFRMLRTLATEGHLSPSDATRLAMLVCESGVELRPLWTWDIPRVSGLSCHPSDAWCIAIAEGLGVPFVTRNPNLALVEAVCPIEVY